MWKKPEIPGHLRKKMRTARERPRGKLCFKPKEKET
jgi:hypothetical protein